MKKAMMVLVMVVLAFTLTAQVWFQYDHVDDMTDKSTVYFIYELRVSSWQKASVIINPHQHWVNIALHGLLVDDNPTVTIRFDSDPAKSYAIRTNDTYDMIMVRTGQREIIERMKTASVMKIQYRELLGGYKVLTIPLSGFADLF